MEQWKQIEGFQDYQISNLGNIKSFKQNKNGKLLSLKPNSKGYIVAKLYSNGQSYNKMVHRLVLETFCPIDDKDKEVDHINRNRSDNRLENLHWVTPSENCKNRSNNKKVIRFPDKKIFNNLMDAATESKCNYSHVRDCCENKRVSTGNYQFLYYEENKNYDDIVLPKIGGKSAKQKVINIETGIIYESITEAANQTNISKCNIARCCKGERKTAGGYHWEKVEG